MLVQEKTRLLDRCRQWRAFTCHTTNHQPFDGFTSYCASVSTVMATLTHRDASHKILRLVLWCWIVFHNGFHFLLVSLTISLEKVVRIGLRWRIGVWVIEKILDTE